MKNLKLLTLSIAFLGVFAMTGKAQTDVALSTACQGYPKDEICCQKNRGTLVTDDSTFCYLNLRMSRVTKAECLDAGGYAYWRNDSTILCIPKGTLLMSGSVIETDEVFKTIALTSEGNTYNIIAGNMVLPKPGDEIDIYYTIDHDGVLHAKTCHPLNRLVE